LLGERGRHFEKGILSPHDRRRVNNRFFIWRWIAGSRDLAVFKDGRSRDLAISRKKKIV
jgi:hypothetical protein